MPKKDFPDNNLPIVVNKKKKQEYDIFIGRPSKWGNPFIIGVHGNRQEVVKQYQLWLAENIKLLESLPELFNKRIACFCSPDLCHGDILKYACELYQKYPIITIQEILRNEFFNIKG